jgi:O-antigen biosynthesis protein
MNLAFPQELERSDMLFGCTRHYQRYEYLINMGYVDGKKVMDIGCGNGYGTALLATRAKVAYGIDPFMKPYADKILLGVVFPSAREGSQAAIFVGEDYMSLTITEGDVATLVETIEHVKEPAKMLEKIANEFEYMFITTPMAIITGPTRNDQHVQEFASKDFIELVSKDFEILDLSYQDGGLNIWSGEAAPRGDSFELDHIVQMAWCKSKRKGGKNV